LAEGSVFSAESSREVFLPSLVRTVALVLSLEIEMIFPDIGPLPVTYIPAVGMCPSLVRSPPQALMSSWEGLTAPG
jgi:hypothetical protein